MNISVRASLLGCLALLCISSSHADAQSQFETRGRIHLSFEPDRVVQHRRIEAYEPFHVYVLIEIDEATSVKRMSLMAAALRFDPSIGFGNSEWYDASSHTLQGLSPGLLQFTISWQACRSLNVGVQPVAHFVCVLQQSVTNALVGVEGIDKPGFPPGPGWYGCGEGAYIFAGVQNYWSQLTINGQVPVQAGSWGSIKALYGEVEP